MKNQSSIADGFLAALTWAEGGDDSSFDHDDRVKGVHPDTLKAVELGCKVFIESVKAKFGDDLPTHNGTGHAHPDSGQGGHDLFLTARGHGAGFWDGDWTHGDELTELAHAAFPKLKYVGFFIDDAGLVCME